MYGTLGRRQFLVILVFGGGSSPFQTDRTPEINWDSFLEEIKKSRPIIVPLKNNSFAQVPTLNSVLNPNRGRKNLHHCWKRPPVRAPRHTGFMMRKI